MRPIIRYTYLSFFLNSLLDQKKSLDIRDTINHIEDGTLFSWLEQTFDEEIDLSLYNQEDRVALLETFRDFAIAIDASKKLFVEYNGISLLLAYCIEGIQRLNKR